jgi:hypothetical protein
VLPRQGSLTGDVVSGALAGAAATWLMNQATTWMYAMEGEAARERENAARGGSTAYANAASTLAETVDVTLSEESRQQGGSLLHWLTGTGAGVAYAVARRRWPLVARAAGLPFGAGFFLAIDEGVNTALGFTPGPRASPWQTHARGLVGHLVFGFTVEVVLRGLDRAMSPGDQPFGSMAA